MEASRASARAYEQQLRLQAAHVDLRNDGRYRSTHLLFELFFELVRVARPGRFVEAGAFDATASRRVAEELPGTQVVAFEANPSNHRLWTGSVDFAAAGVEYLNLALSDEPGPVTFHLSSADASDPDDVVEDSSILPRAGEEPRTGRTSVSVGATTLDGHFPDRSVRGAMWVDVEGANQQVLSGGTGFLETCDVLQVEVEDIGLWEGQWLAVDVFQAVLATGLVPVARDVQHEGQYNVLCVSERLLGQPATVRALEEFLRRQLDRELPGLVGRVRRNDVVRRAARTFVRRG